MALSTILIIVLILLLIGALPAGPYSRTWGYRPMGGLGIVLIIIIVLLVMRVFCARPWQSPPSPERGSCRQIGKFPYARVTPSLLCSAAGPHAATIHRRCGCQSRTDAARLSSPGTHSRSTHADRVPQPLPA